MIRALLFDLDGTLRLVERDAAFEAEARRKIAEMCGEKGDPDEFCKFLDYRYAGYRKWCFETMKEAPEEELWTKWLTPEYDRELIKKNAVELTYQFRRAKGERVVVPGGIETVRELRNRGYKVGIISDLIGTIEIDEWLDKDGIRGLPMTFNEENKPDCFIHHFNELLELFPGDGEYLPERGERRD